MKTKRRNVSASVPLSMARQLKHRAWEMDVSVSGLLRLLIDGFLSGKIEIIKGSDMGQADDKPGGASNQGQKI